MRGYKFGTFELDLDARELRRNGLRVKVQEQPLTMLELLLERADALVTREEVQKRLWPQDTFVDFEKGLNTAAFNLRAALGDDAENPRFVQTVPKKGYRFIAPVEDLRETIVAAAPSLPTNRPAPTVAAPVPPASAPPIPQAGATKSKPRPLWPAITALIVIVAAAAWIIRRFVFAPPPARVVLAVLPFENLSGDKAQEYFSQGQTDELITQLSRVNPGRLGVIGFATVSAYTQKDPVAIGHDLRVQYVVEGSVQRTGDRVHINARLLETKDRTAVWAKGYDGGFSAQTVQEVAQDIAQSIRVQLQPQPPVKTPANTEAAVAYDALLRGRYLMTRRTDEDLKRSIQYLQQAVAANPSNAPAHASLADIYNLLGFYSLIPPAQAYPKAKAEATLALQTDPTLAEAEASLADLSYIYEWNWDAAERHFQEALRRNPNYAPAHQWYGMFLASQGKFDAGIAEVQEALKIEPLSPVINADLGLCYYYSRQYDRALAQYEKTLELDKNFSLTHNWMGMTLVKMKRYDDAIAHFRLAVEYSGGSQGSYALLAYAYGTAGRKPEAQSTLKQLQALTAKQYVSPAYIAIAYIGLGERDQVFQWANRCREEHAALMVRLKVEPVVDTVRDDPRFPKLLESVGLKP